MRASWRVLCKPIGLRRGGRIWTQRWARCKFARIADDGAAIGLAHLTRTMDIRFINYGSEEWRHARRLRYAVFFSEFGLPMSVMDDQQEVDAEHLAAFEAGKLIGCGRLADMDDGYFEVSQLVVMPSHRRCGLGTRILQILIATASTRGAAAVRLAARLPAVEFYLAAGFKPEGEAFPSGKTGVPHLSMCRKIRPQGSDSAP